MICCISSMKLKNNDATNTIRKFLSRFSPKKSNHFNNYLATADGHSKRMRHKNFAHG